MVEIEFNYKQDITIIQANLDASFELIIEQFIKKTNLERKNVYFLANGIYINKNDIIENIMSESEKQNKKMTILVYSINTTIYNANSNSIKSNDIICPECKELCKYEIKNYRIKLFGCKNGHIIENIKLNEFNNTQNIDISKIKCDTCQDGNKSNTFNNDFYICNKCNINLCPLCKSSHDNNHFIIKYDNKNYICSKHNETFVKYCEDCKIDLCLYCVNDHTDHNLISFEDRLINIEHLRKKMNELRKEISIFKNNLEKIISKLKIIMENMDIYYEINDDILINFENYRNKNYKTLSNLNSVNESIDKEIFNITTNYNYGNNLNKLIYLYNEIFDENTEIEFNYKPTKEVKEKLRIFGNKFVNNNIYKCKIIYKNEEYDLKEFFNDIDSLYNNKNPISIILKGINNISDLSFLFNECSSLSSLPDISNLDSSNITNMSFMFSGCKSLISVPDISCWDTSNVTNMGRMFSGCNSLTSLPDMSGWDVSRLIDISGMFADCNSLISLPDISQWNVSNISYMSRIFSGCNLLKSLPDISKWNTSNATNMSGMFYECKSLISIPDISKWNISNITSMSGMFFKCNALVSLPDLSKWNVSNVTLMNGIFYKCKSLSSLPDISNWNTSKVTNMNGMFFECKKSLNIPSKYKKL